MRVITCSPKGVLTAGAALLSFPVVAAAAAPFAPDGYALTLVERTEIAGNGARTGALTQTSTPVTLDVSEYQSQKHPARQVDPDQPNSLEAA